MTHKREKERNYTFGLINKASIMKQLMTLLLAALLMSSNYTWATSGENIIDMADTNPPSTGSGWTYANSVYTITNGADVIVTGKNTANRGETFAMMRFRPEDFGKLSQQGENV
jgi:hypothetical protein